MHITMVKKRLANGDPCQKCAQTEEMLRRRGHWDRIDEVVWAIEGEPDAPGWAYAKRHGVEVAPFFVIEDGGEETALTSPLRLIKKYFDAPAPKPASARLDGAECVWAGIATHYLPAEKLAEAKARIIEHPDRIGGILSELAVTPPEARIEGNAALIKKHFASDRLEDILASLEEEDSEWAAKELATLRSKSPQTCKVALRQLADSAKLDSFADNMRMEYRIASRVLTRPDFAEGVRAVIVDKTNDPKWNPATPEGVSEELIDSIFAPLPEGEEWTPLQR